MRSKTIMIAVIAGFVSLNASAGFEQFNDPVGGMNVFNKFDAYQFSIVPYGLPDLRAITTDDRTFELLPNVNLYADNVGDPVWRDNGGAGPDGNSILEQNTLFEIDGLTADLTSVTFSFNVDAFDIDLSRYQVKGFIKVLKSSDGSFATLNSQEVILSGTGSQLLTLGTFGLSGELCQAGWSVKGLNANPDDDWGSVTVTATDLFATSNDNTAPTPDKMIFNTLPAAISDGAISMTASNATDAIYGVEYLFTNTANNTSSGWRSSPVWIDSGPTSGIATSQLAIVNADFATDGSSWTFEDNTILGFGGDPSGSGWTNDAGNGVSYGFVNGSEDNGDGGFAVIYQTISLSGSDFGPGDTVTLSADIKALAGLNGGGALLKMESYNGGSKLNELEVQIPGTTESWDNYSMDYTIAAGADSVRAVLGLATGYGGQNATDSFYLFDNVVVNGEVEVTSGLTPNTSYTYQVKARDTGVNANETAWSDAASVATNVEDNDAPTPSPMTFAGTDVSAATVKLTATTATDASLVQYYFTCTAGDGNDSGWQSSPIYYDTGLTPGSDYSYTVIARDISLAKNSNTVSAATDVTTLAVEPGSFDNALTGFTGNTDDPEVLFQLEKIGLTTGSTNPDSKIDMSASGATFGTGFGATGRNVLKTISSGYAFASFEAYATLTFSGATDLSGFIGIGQGLQTGVPDNFGVPELNLEGVNGIVAEFKDTTAASAAFDCSLLRLIGGSEEPANGATNIITAPIGSTETIRAKLTYDSVAQTVNVVFDKNYTGGAFVADQDMGTVSTTLPDTTSMWVGAPVRVYVGGGEGTIVKDFEIVITRAAQPTFDILASDTVAGVGMVLAWDGAFGHTYDVQYSTNLVTGPWFTDPSLGASDIYSDGGAVSATSTVDGAAIFYQILSR